MALSVLNSVHNALTSASEYLHSARLCLVSLALVRWMPDGGLSMKGPLLFEKQRHNNNNHSLSTRSYAQETKRDMQLQGILRCLKLTTLPIP